MNRKEIHFVIDRAGNIQSTIKGVKGSACGSISRQIMELGQVIKQKRTNEYFEERNHVELSVDLNRSD